jgi:hypothetical protein
MYNKLYIIYGTPYMIKQKQNTIKSYSNANSDFNP